MNPIISSQIAAIQQRLIEATEQAENLKGLIDRLKREKEDLIKEQWRLKRQINTFERSQAEIATLNQRLAEAEQKEKILRDGLKSLLQNIKRLDMEIRTE